MGATVTRRKALAVFALLLCAAAHGSAGAGDFVVIVNAGNPVAALTRRAVSDIFLKKTTTWSDGERTKPVDLQVTSAIRESFSRAVHRRPARDLAEFWQREIFSGRGVPPPQKASEVEVIDYVARTPGAIGYVAAGIPLPPGVRAIQIQAER